jgi:hypothetical protein
MWFRKASLYKSPSTWRQCSLRYQSECVLRLADQVDVNDDVYSLLAKDWNVKYERLTNFVVPRSSV